MLNHFFCQITCELKLLPWKLNVKSPTNRIEEIYFSPSSFCAEVMAQLVNQFSIKDSDDYGLYFRESSGEGFWLDSTEKLVAYDFHKKSVFLNTRIFFSHLIFNFREWWNLK